MPALDGHRNQPQEWIVVCPESRVEGGIWRKWFDGGYVAVGWPPPGHDMDGGPGHSFDDDAVTPSPTWTGIRNCLHEMRVGDKIIPHLMEWRIGPVGTVRALRVKDSEWYPTVGENTYTFGPDDHRVISTIPD